MSRRGDPVSPRGAHARIVLRPGKEKSLLRRHPWVYASAIARCDGDAESGATVAVCAADGRFLAWAAYSPASSIRARAWSFDEATPVSAALLEQRVQAAVARRAALAGDSNALRLVFGEADGLPGLIVDRYGEQLVVQFQAAGVEAWRETLLDALVRWTGCADVYDRSDGAGRTREGLQSASGVLRGSEPPEGVEIVEHGLRFQVDVRRGHKTGYYIDQRDNRRRVRDWVAARTAAGATVRGLNCFCYTGGFSIAMALRTLQAEGARFDVIVLDPPKFASSHHHVDRAARAYKDINLNALRLLAPGGALFTYSCSGAIDVDLFQKIVAGAVIDSRVDAWLVARLGAGCDHPLMMTVPESEYLKGVHLERVA
ncbi:MAG: class I SAM-dependent methyltransferase [Burkholderiaceae bacterium]|nr:class I SAM-dependent methyltransferase [Burkholderiaceae bacterium]